MAQPRPDRRAGDARLGRIDFPRVEVEGGGLARAIDLSHRRIGQPRGQQAEEAAAALLDQDVAPFPAASDDAPAAEATAQPAQPLAANDIAPTTDAQPTDEPRPVLPRRRKKKGAGVDLVVILALGALGMLAFGTAMAAFVRASTAPGGDAIMIAWVLIALAVACIGVSGYNLYQRWGRADRP